MKKILIIFIFIAVILPSCDIDRKPFGSIDSEQIIADPDASLQSLLNGMYAQLKTWSDPMHRLGEYAGDNIMIRGASTDAFYEFITFSRTPNNYRLTSFWNTSYKAIAQASNIIKMIDEGQSETIDNHLGECYFVRGLMYFYLTRAFGRPYYQDPGTNLGVPIVNGTPDDVINLHLPDRATVQACYEQSINDLKKAASLMNENRGPIYASKEAAWALLSRVYLYMSGTYDNPNTEFAQLAVNYADSVIKSGKYALLDRQSFMEFNIFTPEENEETIFAIKRVASEFSGYDFYYTVGGMYANIGGMGWGEMYASAKYLHLLNETGRNDWRPDSYHLVDARAAFIDPQYQKDAETGEYVEVFRFIKKDDPTHLNYVQAPIKRSGSTITCTDDGDTYTLVPVDKSQGIYKINYKDDNTYIGVIDYFIALNRVYPEFYITKCSLEGGTGTQLHSPVISTLAEVYLNRAEAYAKLGQYGNALQDLNTIRTRSIVDGGYSSLDASNAPERIDKERQLELAFQAERSYDVFRNGDTLKRHYPGPHNQFEDILPTDYRVVYYIPQDAINSYPGTLTQNPTK